jgi:hypothetical protein
MIRLLKFLILFLMLVVQDAFAVVDSYRFLHVTIDTPWLIFIFLLAIILFPFVLMAILYWHYALRKNDDDESS